MTMRIIIIPVYLYSTYLDLNYCLLINHIDHIFINHIDLK